MSDEFYTIEPSGHNRWEVWHIGAFGHSWCGSFRWKWQARRNVRQRIARILRVKAQERRARTRSESISAERIPIPSGTPK